MSVLPAKLMCLAILFISIGLKAQQPILKVDSKDSINVSLTKMKTEVKVIGNYAVTTMEMEFCNSAPRVLEGELVFPMPDGVSVSRYAIDINGNMREAVPVEKEKGQVAFENIERRRVDPGILEKVEGNNFRTRIYPIPASGCRKVIIGYEQLLPQKGNHSFLYLLPFHFKRPLKEFEFSITVASNYIPEVGSDCNTHLKFEELNKVFTAEVSEKNYRPNGAFNIIIPKTPDATEVSMQQVKGQYYFLINTFPGVKKVEKKTPDAITIIWDVSLSGQKRDHKKEFELLDSYIKARGRLAIHLYQIGLDLKKINDYNISGGNWSDMRKRLENIVYDGATDLSAIKYLPGEEFLVFTDGLSTFGNIDNMILPQKPVHTICAAATADYSLLKYISAKTGGAFINLNELDIAAAQKYLTEQTLKFLGIKSNGNISEVCPAVATAVEDNCSIAGICSSASANITLQFGYGATVVSEQSIDMSAVLHNTNFINIEKIWAQKKIADLDIQYEKNKDAINALGKKYTIITRNTSLIVLEAIQDYVRYDIEPPAELMGEYTKLLDEKRSNSTKRETGALAEAGKYFGNIQSWWNEDFDPAAIKKDSSKKMLRPNDATASARLAGRAAAVSNDSANVIANYPVTEDGDRDGIRNEQDRCPDAFGVARYQGCPVPDTDRDGVNDETDKCLNEPGPSSNFGCPLIPEMIVMKMKKAAPSTNHRHVKIPRSSVTGDVVVVGYGIQRRAQGRARISGDINRDGDGVADVYDRDERAISGRRTSPPVNDSLTILIKEPLLEKPYLAELSAVAKEDRYKKYLELRKDNNLPPFYLNVANIFLKDGDTTTGYLVLSNIAELNLDDHELYKMLGYRLKTIGRFDDEVMVFKKVLQLRPQDPQSYRDYALALADAGKYQQALDTLYLAITRNYDQELKSLYPGIEEIIVTEINDLIVQHGTSLNTSKIDKELIKSMPVDVRVVLNWNMNATDIDLWVFDPNNEKCFYNHTLTAIGGRISKDFTRGYGPEQFMLKKAMTGKYKVMLNYYGDTQQKIAGLTTVMAEIFTNYGTASEQRKMITLQMQKGENKEVLVGEFSF